MRTVLLHGLTAVALAMSGVTLAGCDAAEDGAVEEEQQEGEEGEEGEEEDD